MSYFSNLNINEPAAWRVAPAPKAQPCPFEGCTNLITFQGNRGCYTHQLQLLRELLAVIQAGEFKATLDNMAMVRTLRGYSYLEQWVVTDKGLEFLKEAA
jgi:hypothetical protein